MGAASKAGANADMPRPAPRSPLYALIVLVFVNCVRSLPVVDSETEAMMRNAKAQHDELAGLDKKVASMGHLESTEEHELQQMKKKLGRLTKIEHKGLTH